MREESDQGNVVIEDKDSDVVSIGDSEAGSSSGKPSNAATYLDPLGDLRLRVKHTNGLTEEYVVCSKAMARSSPVWNAMLFGGYKESRPPNDEWIVSMEEDKPEALLTILHIIHGAFNSVPHKITSSTLYDLLTVTEKYDMTHVTRPWAQTWMKDIQNHYDFRSDTIVLFVAWEMGDQLVFEDCAHKLVQECCVDSEGHLVRGGQRIDQYTFLQPPGLCG
jgi:hypothetical protein